MKPLRFLPILVLAVRALADPAATPAPEDHYDKPLQAELLAILESDQGNRSKVEELTRANPSAPEARELWQKQMALDAANQVKIGAILDQHGWVGPELVGLKASSALFYVIQHANTAMQKKYLPLLRSAVQQGKAPGGQLAMMEDRVALAEGRRQVYGTQLGSMQGDTKWQLRPIEDPDHVDERRAAIGLPPMAEYLKHWNMTWDVEAFKKEMPAIEQRWRVSTAPDSANYDQALRKQLLGMMEDIQALQRQYRELSKQATPGSAELAALGEKLVEKYTAYLPEVSALLDTRGWIGTDLIGYDGQNAILMVLQNSNLAIQRKYLPMMRAAVQADKMPAAMICWIEDTVTLTDTGKQIYGTQVKADSSGRNVVQPIEDPEHVDERRIAAGVPPMAEYLKHWNLTWDAKAFAAAQAKAEAEKK